MKQVGHTCVHWGLVLVLGFVGAFGCTADSQPQRLGCTRTADCPAGEVCQQGVCALACLTDADCVTGLCDTATGECVECLEDTDCSEGLICESQACTVQLCTPGEVTCADSQGFKTCNERGDGYIETLCPDDTWCVEGECQFACPSTLTDCTGSCRDLQTDRAHCGGCDIACGAGEVCSMGACELCLLYTSPSPRDQRGDRKPACA